jgi:hypothetical protein
LAGTIPPLVFLARKLAPANPYQYQDAKNERGQGQDGNQEENNSMGAPHEEMLTKRLPW